MQARFWWFSIGFLGVLLFNGFEFGYDYQGVCSGYVLIHCFLIQCIWVLLGSRCYGRLLHVTRADIVYNYM